MAKNHSIFITIKNQYQEYVECLKTIDNIKSCMFNASDVVDVNVIRYKSGSIIANKLEEPLDGENINSSVSIVANSEWLKNQKSIFSDSHIHLRVLYDNSDLSDYLKNLHYLSLILCKHKDLILEKRFSVFLVPRTGVEYPFSNGEKTDTELYEAASARLRAFIGKENQGVIYGVAKSVTSENKNVVKALDFKKISLKSDCFPIIYLQGNISYARELTERYFSDKNHDFESSEIEKLNHYSLLFSNGIVNEYIKKICKIKKGQRFGYSNHSNPRLALVDYIFEVSASCLYDKLLNKGIQLNDLIEKNTKITNEHIYIEIGRMNIFTFALFAFLFSFSKEGSEKIENILIEYIELANEISSALSQIVQNSLQHSAEKISIISFFRTHSGNNEQQLKIIISDLGNKSILATFQHQLHSEKYIVEKLHTVLDIDFSNVVASDKNLLKAINMIELKHLFNNFENCGEEILRLWKQFRENDSSAHIGLALFSQIMERCNADYYVVTSGEYTCENKNLYFSGTERAKVIYKVIPGTEFNITIPIKKLLNKESFSLSQLNNGKYCENYDSYASFLDFHTHMIAVPEKLTDRTLDLFNKSEHILSTKPLDKFSQQLVLTVFWIDIFNTLNDVDLRKFIINLDFNTIGFKKGYLENSEVNREVIVKGFLNAIGMFSEKHKKDNIYFAVTNLSGDMIIAFQNILLSLSIKKFPQNLQIFLSECRNCDSSNVQMHLVGSTYGEAIQNAFIISIENGAESFEPRTYLSVTRLCKPFKSLIASNDFSERISIAPFTMFITNSEGDANMFFENVKTISEKELVYGNGYKICNTHTRLGNKVHINAFYEMSFLFYRTIMANRVAFEIIRDLMKSNSGVDIINDSILFYGYASYSQAILTSLTNIVKSYRAGKNSAKDIYYAVYQYNLQSESNADEIKVFLNRKNINIDFLKIIQIVPISSTLTTFEKMWVKFKETASLNKYELVRNYSVIWVRDDLNDASKKESNVLPNSNSSELIRTKIEDSYYIPYKNNRIEIRSSQLNNENCKYVDYIISTCSLWQSPEICKHCYPDNVLEEKPLIETDPTSTVPSQQITLSLTSKEYNNYSVDKDNLQRIIKIKGNVYYGHYKRGKNHFQYYIDTINYFSKVEGDVKKWLQKISVEQKKKIDELNMPYQSVIFSPEHNTNVGFSQYVNAYYFNGTAEIISLNEDKEFRSNFICEHAALKNTIERLFLAFGDISSEKYLPVKFYFVDDNIITGATLHKASSLLQSLIPKKYIHLYSTTVFDRCFFLIDRLSDSSKISYVIPTKNFISFCHINVSNIRIQGDSCVGCKTYNQAKKFAKHSATNYIADFWGKKVCDYESKSFETLSDRGDDKSYYMLSLSHVLKELFELNQSGDAQTYYDMITDFFLYLCNANKKIQCANALFLEQYSSLWNIKNIDNDHRKMIVECLLKIISRPFFSYNFAVKAQALRFIISISEYILYSNNLQVESEGMIAQKSIIGLYKENDKELYNFLTKNVFRALTDLHSTYLIRKKTIAAVLQFVDRFADSKQFWKQYTIYVKEIVDGSADESRCFWLEHLLNTGYEITDTEHDAKEKKRLFEVIILESQQELKEETKEKFKWFLEQLLIENGRILFDNEENRKSKSIDDTLNANKEVYYFARRFDKFIESDLLSIGKSFRPNNVNRLFKYINSGTSIDNSHTGKDIIRERYDSLIRETHTMISDKYNIRKKDIRIAILTCSREKQETPQISEFDVVSETISSENSHDYNISKYIIKERIVNALSDKSIKSVLEENGYYICPCDEHNIDGDIKSQEDQNCDSSYHIESYMILYFNISDKMISANTELKNIIPVYLYISLTGLDDQTRKALPAFIVRDILINKNALNLFLVADFTSDVLQRYAHSIGTEAVLKTDKEISHSSLSDDSLQIEKIMKMCDNPSVDLNNNNKITREKLLEWFTVRNYCNMVTARLHNRVMRNFNKSLGMIISDSENSDSVKLYVEADWNDGYSIPLSNLNEILPIKNTNDCIFELFKQIITFDGVDELVNNRKPVVIKFQEKKYTYNRDYVKNLIYCICFDALRFSIGSGAENNDFVERIKNHYKFVNLVENANNPNYGGTEFKKILSHYQNSIPCHIQFSIEEGTEHFDWLVVKNELDVHEDKKKIMDSIKKKLSDPLDFADGHMSLIAHKEFLCKLFDNLYNREMIMQMYAYGTDEYDKEYFITRLPIIAKLGGNQ